MISSPWKHGARLLTKDKIKQTRMAKSARIQRKIWVNRAIMETIATNRTANTLIFKEERMVETPPCTPTRVPSKRPFGRYVLFGGRTVCPSSGRILFWHGRIQALAVFFSWRQLQFLTFQFHSKSTHLSKQIGAVPLQPSRQLRACL